MFSSRTSGQKHCRVDKITCRVEKYISLERLRKYQSVFVRQKGPSNWLSSRTSRTSGHKHCRVDKENCRVEKCISLVRLRKYQSAFVRMKGPSNRLSSRTSRRVDTNIVESTKKIVEWKNASH